MTFYCISNRCSIGVAQTTCMIISTLLYFFQPFECPQGQFWPPDFMFDTPDQTPPVLYFLLHLMVKKSSSLFKILSHFYCFIYKKFHFYSLLE